MQISLHNSKDLYNDTSHTPQWRLILTVQGTFQINLPLQQNDTKKGLKSEKKLTFYNTL